VTVIGSLKLVLDQHPVAIRHIVVLGQPGRELPGLGLPRIA